MKLYAIAHGWPDEIQLDFSEAETELEAVEKLGLVDDLEEKLREHCFSNVMEYLADIHYTVVVKEIPHPAVLVMPDQDGKPPLVCRCGNRELRTSDQYRWECDECHRVWALWENHWTIIAGEDTDPEYHHSNEDGLF